MSQLAGPRHICGVKAWCELWNSRTLSAAVKLEEDDIPESTQFTQFKCVPRSAFSCSKMDAPIRTLVLKKRTGSFRDVNDNLMYHKLVDFSVQKTFTVIRYAISICEQTEMRQRGLSSAYNAEGKEKDKRRPLKKPVLQKTMTYPGR